MMRYSGLAFSLVVFTVLHITHAFMFGGDLLGGLGEAMTVMGGMGGLMAGGMNGAGLGTTMSGMEGLFGGQIGGTGGAIAGTEGFLGGGMVRPDTMMGGAMVGSGNTLGGMDGMFGGLMGGGMDNLFGSGMGSGVAVGMGGGMDIGMQMMLGQLGQGQKAAVTKKCMSPFWLKYCKCDFMCPKGHLSYGNCEDFKENAFLPTMCCPENVHYACVLFEI